MSHNFLSNQAWPVGFCLWPEFFQGHSPSYCPIAAKRLHWIYDFLFANTGAKRDRYACGAAWMPSLPVLTLLLSLLAKFVSGRDPCSIIDSAGGEQHVDVVQVHRHIQRATSARELDAAIKRIQPGHIDQ